MVNKPRIIGTAAESAVVRYIKDNGFPYAERRALHGGADMGDVTGVLGLVIEVKAGEVARDLPPGLVTQWLRETETERVNAGADIGLLVMQRKGFGVTRAESWWTMMPTHVCIMANLDPHSYVMMTLADAVVILRRLGYGDSDGSMRRV